MGEEELENSVRQLEEDIMKIVDEGTKEEINKRGVTPYIEFFKEKLKILSKEYHILADKINEEMFSSREKRELFSDILFSIKFFIQNLNYWNIVHYPREDEDNQIPDENKEIFRLAGEMIFLDQNLPLRELPVDIDTANLQLSINWQQYNLNTVMNFLKIFATFLEDGKTVADVFEGHYTPSYLTNKDLSKTELNLNEVISEKIQKYMTTFAARHFKEPIIIPRNEWRYNGNPVIPKSITTLPMALNDAFFRFLGTLGFVTRKDVNEDLKKLFKIHELKTLIDFFKYYSKKTTKKKDLDIRTEISKFFKKESDVNQFAIQYHYFVGEFLSIIGKYFDFESLNQIKDYKDNLETAYDMDFNEKYRGFWGDFWKELFDIGQDIIIENYNPEFISDEETGSVYSHLELIRIAYQMSMREDYQGNPKKPFIDVQDARVKLDIE